MEVQFFFKQCCCELVIFNCDGEVHKTALSWCGAGPLQAVPLIIHILLKGSPHLLVESRVRVTQPDA